MDPTETYLAMYRAMSNREYKEARELAKSLKEWLDKGGFYPPNYTEVEVKAYLLGVLRRTAAYEN